MTFLNEWLLEDLALDPDQPDRYRRSGLERRRACSRPPAFITEMQYQHMVFEEFARRVQPAVDPFVFTNNAEIDPSIIAEFAHTVYRFGHSMLNDTVDRLDNNLDVCRTMAPRPTGQISLINAFLNPQAYLAERRRLRGDPGARCSAA